MNMRDAHELYKDFLEYAVSRGADLDHVQNMYNTHDLYEGMHNDAERAVHTFENMMYDFLDVHSVHDDPRLFVLMEAPRNFGVNDPYNFRTKE